MQNKGNTSKFAADLLFDKMAPSLDLGWQELVRSVIGPTEEASWNTTLGSELPSHLVPKDGLAKCFIPRVVFKHDLFHNLL